MENNNNKTIEYIILLYKFDKNFLQIKTSGVLHLRFSPCQVNKNVESNIEKIFVIEKDQ